MGEGEGSEGSEGTEGPEEEERERERGWDGGDQESRKSDGGAVENGGERKDESNRPGTEAGGPWRVARAEWRPRRARKEEEAPALDATSNRCGRPWLSRCGKTGWPSWWTSMAGQVKQSQIKQSQNKPVRSLQAR